MGRAFLQGDAGRPGVGMKGLKIHRIYVEARSWMGGREHFIDFFLRAQLIRSKLRGFENFSRNFGSRDAKFQRFSIFTPLYECELNEAINNEQHLNTFSRNVWELILF